MKKLNVGKEIRIESGFSIGLAIPAGEVVIKAINNIDDNRKVREEAEIYLKPIMITFGDLIRENDRFLKETLDNILKLKNEEWITFKYKDKNVDYVGDVVLPISDFNRLI